MRTIRRLVNLVGRARRTVNLIGWLSSVLPLVSTLLVGVRTFLMERSRVLADAPEMVDTVNVGTVMSLIPVWVWVLAGVFLTGGVILLACSLFAGSSDRQTGKAGASSSNRQTGETGTPAAPVDDDEEDDYNDDDF